MLSCATSTCGSRPTRTSIGRSRVALRLRGGGRRRFPRRRARAREPLRRAAQRLAPFSRRAAERFWRSSSRTNTARRYSTEELGLLYRRRRSTRRRSTRHHSTRRRSTRGGSRGRTYAPPGENRPGGNRRLHESRRLRENRRRRRGLRPHGRRPRPARAREKFRQKQSWRPPQLTR
jgi:hypothetical protein